MSFQLGGIQTGVNAEVRRAIADPGSRPAFAIQLNALQAMCRQVFGFRLAMIAIATPFAIGHTASGPATWLIGSAILVTFMGSYVLFRDWERFGPVLLRHPWLLGIDAFFGALLLITASPESTLAYVTVCTPCWPDSSTAGAVRPSSPHSRSSSSSGCTEPIRNCSPPMPRRSCSPVSA